MEAVKPKRTALVIDHIPTASLYVRRVLERRHGLEYVFAAHTAAEALLAFEQVRPDLVTLELGLPDEHGAVLLRRLRQVDAAVPLIVISASQDPVLEQALLAQGAAAVLGKPFSLEALDAATEAALSAPPERLASGIGPDVGASLDAAPLILLVEDDSTTAALLGAAVRRAGCRVAATATSLAQARHQLLTQQPALMLLDVTLPDGDGLVWLERIPAAERPRSIVVSAHCDKRCMAAARRLGLVGYLLKPVSLPGVVTRIAAALSGARAPLAAVH